MIRTEFNKFQDYQLDKVKNLITSKGSDYAGDKDVLANFKRTGKDLDLTPEQVWGTFASKHWDAVMAYCKVGQVESEPIESRLHDIIAYSLLMLAMVEEKKRPSERVFEFVEREFPFLPGKNQLDIQEEEDEYCMCQDCFG